MRTLVTLFLALASQTASALELVLPEYRNATKDREILLQWQIQAERQGLTVDALGTVPLSGIPEYLAEPNSNPTVIEMPPQHFDTAVQHGWIPVSRLERPGQMAQLVLGEVAEVPKLVGTPPNTTAAYAVAVQLTQAPKQVFKTHGDCLRSMVSGQVDACVTSVEFAKAYAKRFDLDIQVYGTTVVIPPSIMLANQVVSDANLERLQGLVIEFPTMNARYIPYDPSRDLPLLNRP